MLASYSAKRSEFLPADIGYETQREIFDDEADRLGFAPPVIDADDVLRNPSVAVAALCAALEIPFSERMLRWPPGPRGTDGAWAPAWYDSVECSTGFTRPRSYAPLGDELVAIADAVRPHYEHLARFKVPKRFVFRELPKTSTGKIQKFVLRDMAKSASAIQ